MKDSTSRIIAICIVSVTAFMVGGLACMRMLRNREPHVELDRTVFPVKGLDISAHNGVPDFDSVRSAGVDFVYLKASEGVTFRDIAYPANYLRASGAGLKVGAYHFFRFDCDGARQAANFLQAIRGTHLDLPLAIDVEESGNPAQIPTELVMERLKSLVVLLRAEGRRVIIYTNKQGHARFVRSLTAEDKETEVWICSFTAPPLGHEKWQLWQHSHIARVPGIKGPVDMNTFNGSRSEWLQWLDRQ